MAFYDQESVTAALAVALMTGPRTLPITFARDRVTPAGGHEPVPLQLLDATGSGRRAAAR
ncbi:MAG TPA: hypothetical protein VF902_08570 [Coriobacteriia bacterium]